MRLSFHTDLALRLLISLAEAPETLRSTGELAGLHRVSHNHLAKVVQTLRKLGLVEVVRGRSGGMRLALPPAEIDVGKAIEMLEGRKPMVDCTGCQIAHGCRLPKALREAQKAFYESLDQQTLADLVA